MTAPGSTPLTTSPRGDDLAALLAEHEPVLGWTSAFGPCIVGCSCPSARDYRAAGSRGGQAGYREHLATALRDGRQIPASEVEALAQCGVGTDLNPTRLSDGTPDAWWIDYLRRHDEAWRNRLRALLSGGGES